MLYLLRLLIGVLRLFSELLFHELDLLFKVWTFSPKLIIEVKLSFKSWNFLLISPKIIALESLIATYWLNNFQSISDGTTTFILFRSIFIWNVMYEGATSIITLLLPQTLHKYEFGIFIITKHSFKIRKIKSS